MRPKLEHEDPAARVVVISIYTAGVEGHQSICELAYKGKAFSDHKQLQSQRQDAVSQAIFLFAPSAANC